MARYIPQTKNLVMAGTLVVAALVVVTGLWAATVSASSVIGVTSNATEVPGGANLVLTVTAQNDGDIAELEVDHNLTGLTIGGQPIPEFSVYADEADPYGGDGALFAAAGATVTYSATANQWVLDLGPNITAAIIASNTDAQFHFVLRDSDKAELWGTMYGTTPENTFSFDLVNGTGDSLVPSIVDEQDEADDATIIPGVPNTGVAW